MTTPKIYWRKHARAFYAYWQRPNEEYKQHWLGKDKEDAKANLARLMAGEEVVRKERTKARAKSATLTVTELVVAFLDWVQANKKPGTYKWYRNFLSSLCEFEGVGRLKAPALTMDHVSKWITANRNRPRTKKERPWNATSAHNAARTVVACYNWAVKTRKLKESPVKGFEKAVAGTRQGSALKPDQWKKLIEFIDGDTEFRDMVMFMRLTGCRPEEARDIEKRHVDLDIPAAVFEPHEWKNGRKGKVHRKRYIQLPPEALVIIQKQSLKYPEGPLFRSRAGTRWTKDSLARKFSRLRVRLKIPKLVPYSIRHTYATDSAGHVDCLVLAELMGTSVKMLESVYTDLKNKQAIMGNAAKSALRGLA